MRKVTERQAEEIRAAIENRFSLYTHEGQGGKPKIFPGSHEGTNAAYVISWEEGPYDWALAPFDEYFATDLASYAEEFGGSYKPDPAVKQPHADKIYLEAVNSFTVALYHD